MCGRSSISKKEANLEKRFNAKFYSKDIERFNPLPNFNVCPTTFVPTISNEDTSNFRFYHWGLELMGYDGKVYKNTINARKENIQKIPLFRESLNEFRCIIPATNYFEWKQLNKGKTKIPYLIKLKDLEIFSLAALYTLQPNINEVMIPKFVLITQTPTNNLALIHDRMPAILTPETEQMWLDKTIAGDKAYQLITQPKEEQLLFYPVSNELNNSFDNNPEFIKEKAYTIPEQGNLF